jgi:hypothetical protein
MTKTTLEPKPKKERKPRIKKPKESPDPFVKAEKLIASGKISGKIEWPTTKFSWLRPIKVVNIPTIRLRPRPKRNLMDPNNSTLDE